MSSTEPSTATHVVQRLTNVGPPVKYFLHAITLARPSPLTPAGVDSKVLTALKKAGFHGVQQFRGWPTVEVAAPAGLCVAGSGRVLDPADLDGVVREWREQNVESGVLHLGVGTEDDAELDRYARAFLDARERHQLPIFLETHRATITQDLWRTVRLVDRFPGLTFNLDFSHWYVAGELTYGNYDAKIDFATPVLERVGFLHARVSSPGCMQPSLMPDDDRVFVEHFRAVWRYVIGTFLSTAPPGSVLPAAVELVPSIAHYAHTTWPPDADLSEESDRWSQALLLRDMVASCVESATTTISMRGNNA